MDHPAAEEGRSKSCSCLATIVLIATLLVLAVIFLPDSVLNKLDDLIPSFARAKAKSISQNEGFARMFLKGLRSSQKEFQRDACVDQDGDGIGEYGYLSELLGLQPCRGTGEKKKYMMIGSVMCDRGVYLFKGFCFELFLRDESGRWVSERSGLPSPSPGAADGQEGEYVAYAWPHEKGRSGASLFAMTQEGALRFKKETSFSGQANPPPPDELQRGSWGREN
ncbi:MAG: hypothetical protein ACYTHN_24200 [Planctomycetota bacterium]|jgi:hypothetical protein